MKIYKSRPDLGGIYRKQADELILYSDTLGFYAMNRSDFEALLNYCFNPSDKKSVASGISTYLEAQ